ncbi:DNA primase [Aerococcus urinaeequi]|uniref:DNA primase n=1 Tax=Aerococcus urinaeequi TaxID=51665 RepID=A0A7M1KUG3_9LACT|nr:DNA primase [Aerococcus urinaeequi]QOQ79822.1 DNA primase [Aerococcus urinaeequi]
MANFIPEEIINEVKNNVNILDVTSQFVDLQKRGRNYFGYCPFHEERTPSFTVNEEKQIFHCFSCGRGGNVFRFMEEIEGYSFPQAVQKVAEAGNVSVSFDWSALDDGKQTANYSSAQNRLIQIHEELRQFYHYLLMNTENGHQGLTYLYDRGLSKETLDAYQIGIAPEDGRLAAQHLLNKEFTIEELQLSGIFVGDQDRLKDRFAGRVMFPLRNPQGKTVGFSGRILPGSNHYESHPDAAKYLNSPETEIFEKNTFLFNLDLAQNEARRAKELVLFEGFMDVIASHNEGVGNGVASMGTSLTNNQIKAIERTSKQVLIAYDGDKPGQKATLRAINLIQDQSSRLKLNVLAFEQNLDPDEFIQKYGGERYVNFVLNKRLSPIHFMRNYYRQEFSLETDNGKIQFINVMLEAIAKIKQAIDRDIYVGEIAEDTGVSKDTLLHQLESRSPKKQSHQPYQADDNGNQKSFPTNTNFQPSIPATTSKKKSQLEKSELLLLYRLLYNSETWLLIANRDFHFQSSEVETVFMLLSDYRENNQNIDGEIDPGDFLQALSGAEEQRLVAEVMNMEVAPDIGEGEVEDLIYNIQIKGNIEQKMQSLDDEIAYARSVDDFAQISILIKQKIDLLKQIKSRGK